jgi:DNA-binding transcriptional regulator YiaG
MASSAVELVRIRERVRNGSARAIRERAGLSRAEVAEDLGVHETTVQKWEAGERSPRGDIARRYARLLQELSEVVA